MSAAGPRDSEPTATAPMPAPAQEPTREPAQEQTGASTTPATSATPAVPAPAPATQTNDSVLTVEVDTAEPTDDDADSAFGGVSNASTSIASSVLNYEYENGRRYHGYRSGSYVLPNDDEEQDRLDLVHHVFLLILDGKLYNAPVSNPQRVLDVGTGTGIWCLDLGDENPGTEVVGTDLSPIQPSWVPPNVKFYIDDAESPWVYPPEEHFDLIHLREMSGSIADWDRLCTQAYNNLKPGGWLELQEPQAQFEADDDTIDRAPTIQSWQSALNEGARHFGKEIKDAHSLKGRMERAGFVDVHERLIKVPVGPWARDPKMKELGRYHREQLTLGIEPYTFGFLGKVMGWSETECRVTIAKVINEVRDKSLHMYIRYYFTYGRRPESAAH